MAAIIDGVTHSGYWKLTADDASPLVYDLFPKGSIQLRVTGAATGSICRTQDTSQTGIISTDASTIDHNGDALATSLAVANYLELYR